MNNFSPHIIIVEFLKLNMLKFMNCIQDKKLTRFLKGQMTPLPKLTSCCISHKFVIYPVKNKLFSLEKFITFKQII